jgi:hypothetical protein
MPNAQPVARTVETPADKPQTKPAAKESSPSTATRNAQQVAQTAQTAKTAKADPEKQWVKTLAAMRTQFASAGVDLLVKLLAVLASLFSVSDTVLSEAVLAAYAESRGRWQSPILLLKTVPNVLKGWKARGRVLDEDALFAAARGRPSAADFEQAHKIIAAVENGDEAKWTPYLRWQESDIEWAREILSHAE